MSGVFEHPMEPDKEVIERYLNTPWDKVHPGVWNALCVIAADWYEEAHLLAERVEELKRSNFKLRTYADYEYVKDAELAKRVAELEEALRWIRDDCSSLYGFPGGAREKARAALRGSSVSETP